MKPTVRYEHTHHTLRTLGLLSRAHVKVFDHPTCGTQNVWTGTVRVYDAKTGRFETNRTIYVLKGAE